MDNRNNRPLRNNRVPVAPVPVRSGKKKHKKQHPAVRVLRIVGTVVLSIFLIMIITGSVFATALTVYIMKFADSTTTITLDSIETTYTSQVLAKNPNYDPADPESEEYSLYYTLTASGERRSWVALEDVPQYLRDAVVYSEDERFDSHDGVDFKRTFASFANLFLHFWAVEQGGSTITQQTIKNITGDDAQDGVDGMARKMREIFRAIDMEKHYTKDEILEAYLNIIYLGNGEGLNFNGVQAAANFYFGKDVSDLDLAESVCITAIIKSPYANNPYINPEKNHERMKVILETMLENGCISDAEYTQACNEKLNVVGDPDYVTESEEMEIVKNQGVSSYYTDAAISQSISILMDEYGIDYTTAESKLYNGGYKIYTNVDLDMQKKLEAAYQKDSNFQRYSFGDDELQSGFFVMDYTGNVKAVVGARGEKTTSRSWSYATQGLFSPGSTIKPIASYGPAVDSDQITWSTLFKDEPIKIKIDGVSTKWPVNYSESNEKQNWTYQTRTTSYMLLRSINTCAAQIVKKLTPAYSYNFLQNTLQFSTLDVDNDVNYAPMTVGSLHNGVHLSELVASYQIFGNGGKYYDMSYVSEILDNEGNVIYEQPTGYTRAMGEDSAYVMNRLLNEVIDDSNGTGVAAKLNKTDVVGKTGTAQDWTNLTFVACTPDYVSGLFLGYENPKQIPTSKYQNVAKIWKNVFGGIAEAEPTKEFTQPDSVVKKKYSTSTGLVVDDKASGSWGWYKLSNVPAKKED
ncbi:MAG: transglycosylase domain-containing protein [Oscillospiraceae bacterium]